METCIMDDNEIYFKAPMNWILAFITFMLLFISTRHAIKWGPKPAHLNNQKSVLQFLKKEHMKKNRAEECKQQ